jgi:hypothetical protein
VGNLVFFIDAPEFGVDLQAQSVCLAGGQYLMKLRDRSDFGLRNAKAKALILHTMGKEG